MDLHKLCLELLVIECMILCPKLRVNKDEKDDGWLCHWMYDSGWRFGDLKSKEMVKNGGEDCVCV